MAKSTGKSEVNRYFDRIPADMHKVLRGAARAGGKVFAAAAEQLSISPEVSAAITVKTTAEADRIVSRVSVKPGWAYSVGVWLEWGTAPHLISVDLSQTGGRTAGRLNRLEKAGSLVINGQFVGKAVHHPGMSAVPFMRPALDGKEREATAAAQEYINSRVSRKGIAAADPEGDDE